MANPGRSPSFRRCVIDSTAADQRTVFCGLVPTGKPRLLFVSHAWGGGIDRHISDLITLMDNAADVLLMRGLGRGGVELQWFFGGVAQPSVRIGGFDASALEIWVNALGPVGFARVHLHHVHGWSASILKLIKALRVPIDLTLHDYAVMCPQYHLSDEHGRYCGEPDEHGCAACLQKRPAAWGIEIGEWRTIFGTFMRDAERIIAPSDDVAIRIGKHFPDVKVLVWPHPEPTVKESRETTKVVILGALSLVKGLRVVESVVAFARRSAPEITFRLIGHSAEPLLPGITATGSYVDSELPRLISDERPDVIWFPAQVPETHSYTLTQALASGCAIVASDMGALRERLLGIERARLISFDATVNEWIAALLSAPRMSSGTDAVDRFARIHTAELATSSGYRDMYAAPLQALIATTPQLDALKRLISAAGDYVHEVDRAIIDVFRIGAFGGHRESIKEVERRLLTLPSGEAHVSGRRAHTALQASSQKQISALSARLQETQHRLEEERVASDLASENLAAAQDNIATLQRGALDAVRHIQHLETEHARVLNSTSWKLTRPFRVVRRVVVALPAVASRSYRLAFRSPDAVARLMRLYRRGGVAALVRRASIELIATTPDLALRTIKDADALPSQPQMIRSLCLSTSSRPTVSIIIPVYGQHLTTFACLKSIAEHPPSDSYEVIVMDDASPDPASDILSSVEGVRFVRNSLNQGFIGNVNTGATAANGTMLVILNNDTVVTEHAFDAMLKTFSEHDNVGMVGAKLLNRDGSLQEAGGIIWRDGSGWNYGRNQDRRDPQFNFVRDVDYCSGAALAITRVLFKEMGGFDTHYAPAYYEDTDLAFRLRKKGLRVLYQPHAEIFHIEGVSHGRSELSGVKAYQTTNARKFYDRWHRELAIHRENGEAPEREAHRGTNLNILIVEACMLTPDQDSGSVRMLNLMRILKNENHHVTFVADNLEGTRRYAFQLEALGVEVLHGGWVTSVHQLLRDRGKSFDAIVFCRHYVASKYVGSVKSYAPRARVIFDTVDLHFVREIREAELRSNTAMLKAAYVTREKELDVMANSDVTLVVSEFEKVLLKEIAPASRVEIVSNIHALTPERPGFAARQNILFVGGFRHPPNVDAIIWYANEVMPHLAQLLPAVVTNVVGSNMTDDIRALQTDRLRIVGYVENLEELLQSARVSIAPLRYGAGVKGKVNEAMNYGIPVVATTCAVEGMHLRSGEEVLVADDSREFALAIQAAYNDANLWQKLSTSGVANVQNYFSMDAALRGVRAILND
jgi:O-antigen biosynthesis protein